MNVDDFAFRQHDDEPQKCVEPACDRPAYEHARCKLHSDLAAYREPGPE